MYKIKMVMEYTGRDEPWIFTIWPVNPRDYTLPFAQLTENTAGKCPEYNPFLLGWFLFVTIL